MMATGLHECASDCPPATSIQTIVRHRVPRPQRGLFAEFFCSECSCLWSSRNGEANERQAEACGWDACPCHREEFQTVLYESGVAA
jgi:hypothetical protein